MWISSICTVTRQRCKAMRATKIVIHTSLTLHDHQLSITLGTKLSMVLQSLCNYSKTTLWIFSPGQSPYDSRPQRLKTTSHIRNDVTQRLVSDSTVICHLPHHLNVSDAGKKNLRVFRNLVRHTSSDVPTVQVTWASIDEHTKWPNYVSGHDWRATYVLFYKDGKRQTTVRNDAKTSWSKPFVQLCPWLH